MSRPQHSIAVTLSPISGDNLATKGEEAALKGNLRELYDITRKADREMEAE